MARPGRPERNRAADHSASLGDSITASTQIRFSVHTTDDSTTERDSPRRSCADVSDADEKLDSHRIEVVSRSAETEILEQNTAIVEGYEAWAEFAAAVRDEV